MRRPIAPASALLTAALLSAALLAGCGGSSKSGSASGGSSSSGTSSRGATSSATSASSSGSTTVARPPRPPGPAYPKVLRTASGTAATGFVPAVRWHGATVAWVARSASAVALLSFDQRYLTLALHSGTVDAGGSGWRYGSEIVGVERRRVVSAFNGGFKFNTGAGGFLSGGRVAVPLRSGLASIVTYAGGRSDIGVWHGGVPAPGQKVVSVRQNLNLLVDHGRPAANIGCLLCWGATLGGVSDPARSALGITADGHLIWAGGEHLTPAALAGALIGARVLRAAELDINPEWVASYLYSHHGGGPVTPVPIVPGQPGVPGMFLAPYSRDFFSVLTRSG